VRIFRAVDSVSWSRAFICFCRQAKVHLEFVDAERITQALQNLPAEISHQPQFLSFRSNSDFSYDAFGACTGSRLYRVGSLTVIPRARQ